MSFYNRNEKTASPKQIESVAMIFLGILKQQNKLNIDLTDKATKKDALSLTVDSINEWQEEANVTLTHGDISVFRGMSYQRKNVWHYEDDASVIALIEEKMLDKLSAFTTEKPATKKPATKKKKATRKPIAEIKPKTKGKPALSLKVTDNEDLLNACADLGVDEDDFLKLLALAGKS